MKIEYVALVYFISCILFSYIANWYYYDLKKKKDRLPIYTFQQFIGWMAPIWPLFIISILLFKMEKTRDNE